jgi:hypothetical protein
LIVHSKTTILREQTNRLACPFFGNQTFAIGRGGQSFLSEY